MESLNLDKENEKQYKTRKCTRKAIYKYIGGLKENNPEQYEKRLQYFRTYYNNKKLKLQSALEKIELLEAKIQIVKNI